jgi:hypothetical protein
VERRHLCNAAGRLAVRQRRGDVAARHVARAALSKLRVVHACAQADSALQATPAAPRSRLRGHAWLARVLVAPPRLHTLLIPGGHHITRNHVHER